VTSSEYGSSGIEMWDTDWFEVAQDRDRWPVLVGTVRNLRIT